MTVAQRFNVAIFIKFAKNKKNDNSTKPQKSKPQKNTRA